jgi:hypothetical protein
MLIYYLNFMGTSGTKPLLYITQKLADKVFGFRGKFRLFREL